VTSAFADSSRQAEVQQCLVEPPKVDLKALLASAPLDGIDLDRSPDTERDVDSLKD